MCWFSRRLPGRSFCQGFFPFAKSRFSRASDHFPLAGVQNVRLQAVVLSRLGRVVAIVGRPPRGAHPTQDSVALDVGSPSTSGLALGKDPREVLVRLVLFPVKALSSDGVHAPYALPVSAGGVHRHRLRRQSRRLSWQAQLRTMRLVLTGTGRAFIWNAGLDREPKGDPIVPPRVGLAEQVEDRVVQALVTSLTWYWSSTAPWHVPVRVPTEAAQHLSNTVGSKTWAPRRRGPRRPPCGTHWRSARLEVVANVGGTRTSRFPPQSIHVVARQVKEGGGPSIPAPVHLLSVFAETTTFFST